MFDILLNWVVTFVISYLILDFLIQLTGLSRGRKFQYVFLWVRKQWRNNDPLFEILLWQVGHIFCAMVLMSFLLCPSCWICPSC